QLLRPKSAQERWRCHNRLEASRLCRFFVTIDGVGVANGIDKFANRPFFDIITNRGGFYPEHTAIKINHRSYLLGAAMPLFTVPPTKNGRVRIRKKISPTTPAET